MNGRDCIRMLRLVADYASEYETENGQMTLRELVMDIQTSADSQDESDLAAEIAAGIRWS